MRQLVISAVAVILGAALFADTSPAHYKFVIFGDDTPLPRGVRDGEACRFCGAKISQYCERLERGDYDGWMADVVLVAVGPGAMEGDVETTAQRCRELGVKLNEYRPEAQVAFVTTVEELKAPLAKVAAARGGWRWFYCADSEELAKTVETVVERNVPAARRSLVPVGRIDEPWWMMRHEKLVRPPERRMDVVFIGDSITHFWETSGSNVWERWFSGENGAPYRAINLGFGGDRTEHVLWRIDHGELDSLAPRAVVLMIGGNNICHFLKSETPLDTVLGVKAVLDRIRSRVPHAKVILHPIFPFAAKPDDPRRVHNDIVNAELRRLADGDHVIWCDFNDQLLEPDGTYSPAMAADGVHPTEAGYVVWARSLVPTLRRVLAPERPVTLRPQTLVDRFWVAPRMNWIVKDRLRSSRYDVAFVGDSLTECWLWDGRKVWDTRFKGLEKVNLGMSGDTVQGVNWRMANGELDTFRTKVIVYCIGGNNVSSTPAEIVAGVEETLRIFKAKQPGAKVLMVGMFPSEPVDSFFTREKYPEVNRRLAGICDGKRVRFVDGWSIIPVVDGRLPDLKDGQHFKESGYVAYADLLEPLIREAIAEYDAEVMEK